MRQIIFVISNMKFNLLISDSFREYCTFTNVYYPWKIVIKVSQYQSKSASEHVLQLTNIIIE